MGQKMKLPLSGITAALPGTGGTTNQIFDEKNATITVTNSGDNQVFTISLTPQALADIMKKADQNYSFKQAEIKIVADKDGKLISGEMKMVMDMTTGGSAAALDIVMQVVFNAFGSDVKVLVPQDKDAYQEMQVPTM